jgi:hypothetical protein
MEKTYWQQSGRNDVRSRDADLTSPTKTSKRHGAAKNLEKPAAVFPVLESLPPIPVLPLIKADIFVETSNRSLTTGH